MFSGQADVEEHDDLAAVWTAARAAAADPRVADEITVAVLVRARRRASVARPQLVADAVRETVARAPCEPLSEVPAAEREAVALARFADLTTEEIAMVLGVERAVVRTRLRDGLRAIGGQSARSSGDARALARAIPPRTRRRPARTSRAG